MLAPPRSPREHRGNLESLVEPWWNSGGTLVSPWWKVEPWWNAGGTLVEPWWNPGGTLVEPWWNPGGILVEPWWNPRGTSPQGRPGPPLSLSGLRPQSFQLLGKKTAHLVANGFSRWDLPKHPLTIPAFARRPFGSDWKKVRTKLGPVPSQPN